MSTGVLLALGWTGLAVLNHSLLAAMGYPRPWPVAPGLAAGQSMLAAALAFRPRHTAAALGSLLAGALAIAGLHGQATRLAAAGARWGYGAVCALVQWVRGTPPALTPDLVWAAVVGLPLLVALGVMGCSARGRDPWWPVLAGALIPVLEWYSYFDRGIDYLSAYVVVAFSWLAAWRNRSSPRGPRPSERLNATGLSEGLSAARAALWIMLVAATVLVPARGVSPYPAVSLGRIADWWGEVVPGLSRMRGGSGTRPVGFNPDARHLGGPLSPGTGVAFDLLICRAEPGPQAATCAIPLRLYLRGTVENRYTGEGWGGPRQRSRLAPQEPGPEWWESLGEAPAAAWLDVEMQVKRRELSCPHLFSPWVPVAVEQISGTMATPEMELTAPSRRGGYAVRARVPLRAVTELYQPGEHDPVRWRPYLELPPSFPPQIRQLAERITAGAPTPFAKASAIEAYLRAAYPYDAAADRPAAGADFVADFLFRLGRGYCVHHSTAMAVMLRSLGIPARWVQGFVVDLTTGTWLEVPASAAHAWVEAHIPGCGWVTFDPTPRYPVPGREYGAVAGRPGGGASTLTPGYGTPPAGERPRELEPDEVAEPGGSLSVAGRPRLPWTHLVRALAAAGVALAGFTMGWLLYRVGRVQRQHRLRRGETPAGYASRQYALVQGYLAAAGLARQPWQTPREFLGQLGPRLDPGIRGALADLTVAVEEAGFASPARAEAGAVAPVAQAARAVRAWVRRRVGWWRWLRWLVLG